MQKAIRDYLLLPSRILERETIEATAGMVVEFWQAVTDVLPGPWNDPRGHLITKGVCVYALTGLMAQVYRERGSTAACSRRAFRAEIAGFSSHVNWGGHGTFKGLGGEAGAKEALRILLQIRSTVIAERVGSHGR
jgi:hypothetical protein